MTPPEAIAPRLSGRHLVLLGEIWDMSSGSRAFRLRPLQYILRAIRGRYAEWQVVEESGYLSCSALVADLSYLHSQRLVFLTVNWAVAPMPAADAVLKAAVVKTWDDDEGI